jgi:hypothetical protein
MAGEPLAARRDEAWDAVTAPGVAPDGPDAGEYGAAAGYPVKALDRVPFFAGRVRGARTPRC